MTAGVPIVAAAAEPAAPLERLIARWRVLEAADDRVVEVLGAVGALPAPGAAAPRAPEPPAAVVGPATADARVWPAARAEPVETDASDHTLRWRVAPAATVGAPAAGRVVFADRVVGLGLVLIIAHGDEYHFVVAGLGSVDVAVGTRVTAGETIGRMAERTESTLELHLELRHHGRPVDPLPWLGADSAGDSPS
jgi:murein DD-endopeptidase MepM/ murein hydrolase activator NlpD